MARDFGLALLVAAAGVAGVLYWVQILFHGGFAPAFEDRRIKLGAAACLLLLLFLPFLLRKMLFPTRLVLGDDGITLSQSGRPQTLAWAEIASVSTQVTRPPLVATGVGTYNPRTITVVAGAGGQKLTWMPIFGVSPEALAAYISNRQAQVCPATPAAYAPQAQSRLQQNMVTVERGLNRLRLAVGAALALVLCVFVLWFGFTTHRLGLW
jgi:hypothetical protein